MVDQLGWYICPNGEVAGVSGEDKCASLGQALHGLHVQMGCWGALVCKQNMRLPRCTQRQRLRAIPWSRLGAPQWAYSVLESRWFMRSACGVKKLKLHEVS